jgi:hypothetical protein
MAASIGRIHYWIDDGNVPAVNDPVLVRAVVRRLESFRWRV